MVVPGTSVNVQGKVSWYSMVETPVKKAYLSLVQRRLKPSDVFGGRLSISGYNFFWYTSCNNGSCDSCNTRVVACVNISLFNNVMDGVTAL